MHQTVNENTEYSKAQVTASKLESELFLCFLTGIRAQIITD